MGGTGMKASDLIERLDGLIKAYGDLEVICYHDDHEFEEIDISFGEGFSGEGNAFVIEEA
jgi:hypothetical protein